MSRIGQKAVAVPSGVDAKWNGSVLSVKGPKGALFITLPPEFQVRIEQESVSVIPTHPEQDLGARHGLYRSLVANMVVGVSRGYVKELEIQGVGFKASVQGRKAVFSLGYSTPAEIEIPAGIDVKVTENVNVVISGPDKQQVGDLAARLKALYPAEPYKGKGIRFKGEHVRRKVGKTVA